MNALSEKRFLNMPNGFSSLFFTQMFSTISFAVLYATLVLYMKSQLHMSSKEADLITGVYFACNFSLHLLSGYLGGRFFSYRGLVITGIIFQLIGCVILSHGTMQSLYWGLSCMLIGTGTMVTCLNMLVSQLFSANDVQKRQSGFLWNYSGMNLGFLLGFSLAGYFQLHVDYSMLFFITAANNVLAVVILLTRWKYMADQNTLMSRATNKFSRYLLGFFIVLILLPILTWLLQHTHFSDDLVLSIGGIVGIALIIIASKNTGAERNKFFAFIILLLSAQIFWIVYQLVPMGLTLFAKDNLDRHVFGFLIAPGWIPNINAVAIIIGAPLLGILFVWLKNKMRSPLLPMQYSFGLALSAIGLLILPIGIALSHNGYTAFIWIFATYVLQAIAELLISPIGYSMVGQLIPARWQSICMGSTLLNSGVAAVLASYFSNYALGKTGSSNPVVTNPSYSHMFSQLGWITMAVAIVLFALTPVLNRLIRD
ncbi:MAG TPA: oligopeptide:H+ symporter [Coxiellaceae bacterium]|nr:MAG: POT family protein [Gammaproteobacteria bacterium RIFCSPHIGHO2_12_FULL_36_30]HLB56556.1 oligopeptide:H+ symporter [Coxiellaceae bacterium]